MNRLEKKFAERVIPLAMRHFGERDADDDFQPVSVVLSADRKPFDWPQVIVGPLTQALVERDGRLVAKETCIITGPTAGLETGSMPLPESVQVLVTRYGETLFHVQPEQSEYGGAVTKLALIRHPFVELASFQDREGG